jgi:hypothetical protein
MAILCWAAKNSLHGTSPLSPFLRFPIPRLDFVSGSCNRAFSTCKSADSQRGGVGGGLGSPLVGISPSKEIRFFDDFSIFI